MKGKNFSTKRQLIYQTIKSTKSHPGARWVYDRLKGELPDLSLGTVYRNIALFKEQGLLVPVATVDGEERFDADTSAHAHFVCRCCGRVTDIESVSPLMNNDPELLPGYKIDSAVLAFFGSCSECCKEGKNNISEEE